jgi:hypothetical protein
MCHVVPAGADPRGNCPAAGGLNVTCTPGLCNGSGACNQASDGTVCQSPQCANGAQTAQATCTAGTCMVPSSMPCTPYVCGATACANPCMSPTDCIPNYGCVNGTCTNCRPVNASDPVYVDPANGTDDANHGAGPGTCAYRTIGYALLNASGTINLLNSGNYSNEGYPLTINAGQVLQCDPTSSGTRAQLGSIKMNGNGAQLLNCDVSTPSTGKINCITILAGATGTMTISNCNIHDCGANISSFGDGIAGNSSTSSDLILTGNTITNVLNCINGLGAGTVKNNHCTCRSTGSGGDGLNACSGVVTGCGNSGTNCTTPCNACTGCFSAGFFSGPC